MSRLAMIGRRIMRIGCQIESVARDRSRRLERMDADPKDPDSYSYSRSGAIALVIQAILRERGMDVTGVEIKRYNFDMDHLFVVKLANGACYGIAMQNRYGTLEERLAEIRPQIDDVTAEVWP